VNLGVTAVDGVRLGHWTDTEARTGCTVVLLPSGTVASGEIRGGAPGTREWGLLAPERTVEGVNAVVLCGGSAFGLAACDGVMRWCEERGIGWSAPVGPVPIVVGMVLYDLGVGDPAARPGAAEGYAACVAAGAGVEGRGPVGAGSGCTVGKWPGLSSVSPHSRAAGLGSSTQRSGDLVVGAVAAVNAVGDVRGQPGALPPPVPPPGSSPGSSPGLCTTIGVVVTNASLSKLGCHLVSQSAHDGLARALEPAHTGADGDAFVAAATGEVEAQLEVVRVLAARAMEEAILEGAAAGAPVR
jgi:L-aminopeptidase/D-esterase-like protein